MIATLVMEVCFTAGLVNRVIDRRLTGLWGEKSVPRRHHVVVVGMGQVGLRLCMVLRRCGAGVVAVDDREEGEHVGVGREFGLPVVIGRGADLALLRSLSLDKALALAAVTDDDLENISIAMAARAVNPDLRVVLRAGDGRLANETRSLFRVGIVRDVHRIAAALLAARATGSDAARAWCATATRRICCTRTGAWSGPRSKPPSSPAAGMPSRLACQPWTWCPASSPGTTARLGAAAQNAFEIARFGGLDTGEEPSPYEVVGRAAASTACAATSRPGAGPAPARRWCWCRR